MTQTTARPITLQINAIDAARLAAIRAHGCDEHGNPLLAFGAVGDGGEPLRCCLRRAQPGESIALVSYAPFTEPSPWREVGPVYVHAETCDGPAARTEPPAELRTGPLVLRTYFPDGSMNYGRITLVDDGEDAAAVLTDLLADPEVAVVHVRTLRPQCFLYSVDCG